MENEIKNHKQLLHHHVVQFKEVSLKLSVALFEFYVFITSKLLFDILVKNLQASLGC